jgi:hypothetical protein
MLTYADEPATSQSGKSAAMGAAAAAAEDAGMAMQGIEVQPQPYAHVC